MTTMTSKETLGRALGRVASGLYVVTTGTGDQKQGMLASWVMQASFEPPTVTIAVQHDREILKHFETTQKCVINVLSDGNSNLMGRFAKYRPDQFEGLDCQETPYGMILQDTVAYLSCEIQEKWNGGDHYLLLCRVVEGDMLNPDLQPWTHLRKNGFVY